MTKKKLKEENCKMKNLLVKMGRKVVNNNAKKEANSACLYWAYQPKMPDSVRKLKKEKK